MGSITKIEQKPYGPYAPYALKQTQKQEEGRSARELRSAQRKLKDLGLYQGRVSGEMNRATRGALRAFQRERRLPVTGKLNEQTKNSLERARDSKIQREERLESWMYD